MMFLNRKGEMDMKKWKKLTAVLAITIALSLSMSGFAYAADGEINVNGTGIVMADPDTASISLSVETMGKSSEAAQKENNLILQKVTKAMQQMGVAKEDIVRLLRADRLFDLCAYLFYLCGTFFDTLSFVLKLTALYRVDKVVVSRDRCLRKTVYGGYHFAVVVLFVLNTVVGKGCSPVSVKAVGVCRNYSVVFV